MKFAQKLKNLRNSRGLSQADLADMMGVSRQAVTKWEIEGGMPEIPNLIMISDIFGITLDSLLRDDIPSYSSVLLYDIDAGKDFEISSVSTNVLTVEGWDSEKVRIDLLSDSISTLDSNIKVSIEEKKRKVAIDLKRRKELSESECRKGLSVRIRLPRKFIEDVELEGDTGCLELKGFQADDLEFGGSAETVFLDDVHGRAEMDISCDCKFFVMDLDGSLEINQIEQDSTVMIPKDLVFRAKDAGKKCKLNLSKGVVSTKEADDIIILNGMKSNLTIGFM